MGRIARVHSGAALAFIAVGVALFTASPAFAANWNCCRPAAPGVIILMPCDQGWPACGTCRTREGLLSGGCELTWLPWNNCTDYYTTVTHNINAYTCQPTYQSCPCPPPGASPDTITPTPTQINNCTGSAC